MEREQARSYLKAQLKDYCDKNLTRSKGKGYVCPYCGSGTGPNGTGAFFLNTKKAGAAWHCFNCNRSGDIFDLYGQENSITDPETQFKGVCDLYGITLDPYKPQNKRTEATRSARSTADDKTPLHAAERPQTATEARKQADFTAYYKACRERLTDPAAVLYLQRRGIDIETAAAFGIGFDPLADPANAPGGTSPLKHPCPRLIIPTGPAHYMGRSIDPNTPKGFEKLNAKGSTPGIFNAAALNTCGAVFVVEGSFDALAIIQAGFSAIALNSSDNGCALLKMLETERTAATLILCPDNDSDPRTNENTQRKFKELSEGLQRLNIAHKTADINGQYKDANAHLTGNKGGFMQALKDATREINPESTLKYIAEGLQRDILQFGQGKTTGFSNLDQQTGGFNAGLYILGAPPSTGKTTFALQIADQMAEAGQHVIYFALEQSKIELLCKSFARVLAKNNRQSTITSLDLCRGKYPQERQHAAQIYEKAVFDRVSIITEAHTPADIDAYLNKHLEQTNARPAVFIDYLQILQPTEGKKTTQEAVDSVLTDLKQISRKHNITVFVISSQNRAGYNKTSNDSLKGSGNIEYSADMVLFLQENGEQNGCRKMQLHCEKNRSGPAQWKCIFDYFPAQDLFEPGHKIRTI